MVKIVEIDTEVYELNKLEDILVHIERCGRTCYKSENLISTETAVPFISGILKSGHESVIEHANVIFSMPNTDKNQRIFRMKDIRGLNVSLEFDADKKEEVIVVSGNLRALRDLARIHDIHDFLLSIGNPIFYVKNDANYSLDGVKVESVQKSKYSDLHNYLTTHSTCDVGAYKDITRHRLASFSIESTRYCNYSKGKFGSELTMIKPYNIEENSPMYDEWLKGIVAIEEAYMKMAELGAKGDQLRMLLPHSTKADMIMTANVSEWRHICSLRCHTAAHPSVRVLMCKMLDVFYEIWPSSFNDLHGKYSV
ncbi:MAG: FAD-dependent thymidylate synthase [Alphaproteobacteria bacterium]|nr:FAD-dependent thymidylate synthase [Alphaproteobacteria bacterium]